VCRRRNNNRRPRLLPGRWFTSLQRRKEINGKECSWYVKELYKPKGTYTQEKRSTYSPTFSFSNPASLVSPQADYKTFPPKDDCRLYHQEVNAVALSETELQTHERSKNNRLNLPKVRNHSKSPVPNGKRCSISSVPVQLENTAPNRRSHSPSPSGNSDDFTSSTMTESTVTVVCTRSLVRTSRTKDPEKKSEPKVHTIKIQLDLEQKQRQGTFRDLSKENVKLIQQLLRDKEPPTNVAEPLPTITAACLSCSEFENVISKMRQEKHDLEYKQNYLQDNVTSLQQEKDDL